MKEEITIGCNTDAAIEKYNTMRTENGLRPIPAHFFKDFTYMKAEKFDDESKEKHTHWYRTFLGEDFANMNVEVVIPQFNHETIIEAETADYNTCKVRRDGSLRTLHLRGDIKQEFYFRLILPLAAIRIDTKEDALNVFRIEQERTNNREAEEIIETASLTL